MAKNVQLTVDIKGGDSVGKAAEKTKTLKQELRELKNELASGNLVGKAFDDAAKKAGELQEVLDDVNQQVKSLANNKAEIALNGFVSLAQGIAGGFTAAQGAMALFGSENEDLQKQMAKLQGAIALLNGIEAVNNSLKKEGGLLIAANSIKTKIFNFIEKQRAAAVASTSVALQGAAVKARMFGAALAATGIGLAIVAVGILAEKFGLFGDSVDETTQKLKESRDRLNEYAEEVAELDALSINRKKRETDLAKARLKLNGATNEELLEQDKRLLQSQKVFLEMQVEDRAKGSIEQKKAIDKLEDVKNQIALKDIEMQTETKNREDKETQKAFEKRKAAQEKKQQQAIKNAEELQKILDEATIIKNEKDLTEQEKEIAALGRTYKAKLDLAKNDDKAQKLIIAASLIERQAIIDKYAKTEEEKKKEADKKIADLIEQRRVDDLSVRDKELNDIIDKYAKEAELAKGHADLLAEIETDKNNALALKKKEFAQQDADFQKEVDNVRLDSMIATANQASQLLSAVAGKNKSVAMAALAVEKGAAIADVIIKGIRERSGITAKYSLIPGGQALAVPELIASRIRTGLSVATIAATGIQGAKSIGNSGGSGGGSVQPPNIRGSQTTNEPTSQPATKVFVTETDIRSVTRKVDGIFTQATIQ